MTILTTPSTMKMTLLIKMTAASSMITVFAAHAGAATKTVRMTMAVTQTATAKTALLVAAAQSPPRLQARLSAHQPFLLRSARARQWRCWSTSRKKDANVPSANSSNAARGGADAGAEVDGDVADDEDAVGVERQQSPAT